MKNTSARVAVLVFAAMVILVLSGCGGGNDPKTLAKQTYDLTIEAMGAIYNPEKTEKLNKELENLEAKVKKLSPAKAIIYQVELARLLASDSGSKFSGALESASTSFQRSDEYQNMVNEIESAVNDPQFANSLNELQNSLNSTEMQNLLDQLKALEQQYGQ